MISPTSICRSLFLAGFVLTLTLAALPQSSAQAQQTDDVACDTYCTGMSIIYWECECPNDPRPRRRCQWVCVAMTFAGVCWEEEEANDCNQLYKIVDFDPEFPCVLPPSEYNCCYPDPPCQPNPNPPNDVYVYCKAFCALCPP